MRGACQEEFEHAVRARILTPTLTLTLTLTPTLTLTLTHPHPYANPHPHPHPQLNQVLPGVGELNAGPRVSLVFKRALVAADGRRGHGLQGEGRRARARARRQASGSDGSARTAAAPAKQGAAPGAANRVGRRWAKAAGAARSRGRHRRQREENARSKR